MYREGFERPCTFLPKPFLSTSILTYRGYYGVDFGQQHSWIANYISNVLIVSPPSIKSIGVHSYSFNGPALNQSGTLRTPSTPFGVVFSISEQCGVFDAPSACTMIQSSILQWSTNPSAGAGYCKLTPNTPYYFNVAYFDYVKYVGNATNIVSTCTQTPNCNSQQCRYECNYHHMASQP